MSLSMMERLRRRFRERRTLLELSSLDDHQLHDIGLIRSQIPAISYEISDRQASALAASVKARR